MADKTVVVAETPPAPSSPADVEAARAAASANAAAEAAAAATSMATVEAARVQDDAAQRLASYEGKMSEWQSQMTQLSQRSQEAERRAEEISTRHGQALDRLISEQELILARLPPLQPDLLNPETNPPADARPAPEPGPPPAKRRPHRWT